MKQDEKLDVIMSEIQYIKGLLENNDKTGQNGIVKQVEINTRDIGNFKTDKKVIIGKATFAGAFFAALGVIIMKLLGLFKLVI